MLRVSRTLAERDPEIADIVDELRNVLRFDGYRLLDTSVLRADLSPEMPASDRPPTAVVGQRLGAFAIQAYVSRAASPDAVRLTVRLRDVSGEYVDGGGTRRPGPAIIDASVTVRSGQTVVLGSGRPRGSENALILVVSPEFDSELW